MFQAYAARTFTSIIIYNINYYKINIIIGATLEGLRLQSSSRCACPGDTLTYECTIMGSSGGATVWTGTALNCPSDEIVLFHQRFTELGGTIRSCIHNNGATVAQSLSVRNDLYTSQLNITITRNLVGKVIMCVYDDMSSMNNVNRDMSQFSTQIPGIA